jgi:hypothetical protein
VSKSTRPLNTATNMLEDAGEPDILDHLLAEPNKQEIIPHPLAGLSSESVRILTEPIPSSAKKYELRCSKYLVKVIK